MAIRVLVVEDEKKMNKMISDYLAALDYEVASAFTGTEALARLTKEAFDMIVLDLMIPGIDGLGLARRVRASDGPPIIMLTARSSEADKLVGLAVGAGDYMTQPLSGRGLGG